MNNQSSAFAQVSFKKRLLAKCAGLIEQRIIAAEIAIANAQAAANAEEKSSAGDKYETSRAMNHLEKDMHAKQLSANRRELAALQSIDCTLIHPIVATGSFVRCEACSFFIAAGLGKIFFEEIIVYGLSPIAPFAKILFGKKPGDIIRFNSAEMIIITVF